MALVGLIALQFYWIQTGIQTNREQFARNVHAMLDAVIYKVARQEALYLTKSQIENNVDAASDFYSLEIDSVGTARWREQQTLTIRQSFASERLAREGYAYEVEEEAVISTTGIARRNRLSDMPSSNDLMRINPELERIFQSQDTSKGTSQLNPSLTLRLAQKLDFVSFIVNELMLTDRDRKVEERISLPMLDSLLQQEMRNRGLNTPYQFGVIDRGKPNPELVYSSAAESGEELLQSPFQTQLFPSDVYDNQNYLTLHFPKQSKYIFAELFSVLIASVGFLVLIIASFAVAIFTILRQKRISDITKDFISNMTHELKTPIATVSLACEALMDPDIRKLPTQGERYLSMIREENERLALQVEKVLQIARLDRGDFTLKVTMVNMHQLIQKAVRNIVIQIEKREGSITLDLQAENPYIEADELHVSNIVNNLLDNANKYSPDAPQITLQTFSNDKGIRLLVTDKGQGISREMTQKIFDKFYRVPTGNVHDVKGFGLGLSYVKTIVDAHHGSVAVKSELGKGSTFIIFLPYKHEQS